MNAKVLWWRFPDNLSAAQVMRVYVNNDERAEEDLALVQLDESRRWELAEVPAFFKDVAFYPVHPDSEVQIP